MRTVERAGHLNVVRIVVELGCRVVERVTATAQARAGDKAAADRLPVLSRTLLELAQNSATSAAEVTAVRASVLDSLATTADIVRTASTATEAAAKARLSGLLGAAGSAATAPDAAMAEMFRNLLSSLLADRAGATTAPGFAAGGWHAGGLRMVGERGPELEATGPARIWSADQTSRMLSGGFDQAALVAELRDSQSYVLLTGLGRSLFDYRSTQVRAHQEDWEPLLRWLYKAR